MVHDLDVFGIAARPAEADAELIVHPPAPLAGTLALQLVAPVRLRRAQVLDTSRDQRQVRLAAEDFADSVCKI